jgi:hypothetical protein
MAAGPRKHVLFGAAYYCEYQPTPRLEMDLNLMAEASFFGHSGRGIVLDHLGAGGRAVRPGLARAGARRR